MELETNTQMDGVDIITRQTKTRAEIQAEVAGAQEDIRSVLANIARLEQMVQLLPEEPTVTVE